MFLLMGLILKNKEIYLLKWEVVKIRTLFVYKNKLLMYNNNMNKDVAKRVSSRTRANGLYSLELKKKGPRFSISKDKKKECSKYACRKSMS